MDFGLILAGFLVGFPSIFGEVSGRCFARFLIKFSTIFGLLARFLVDCSSAVAGTAALLRFGIQSITKECQPAFAVLISFQFFVNFFEHFQLKN